MSEVDLKEHYAIPTPVVDEIDKDLDLPYAVPEAAANVNLEKDFLQIEGAPAVSNKKENDDPNDHSDDDNDSIQPPTHLTMIFCLCFYYSQ